MNKKETIISAAEYEYEQSKQTRVSKKVIDIITRDVVIAILITVILTPLLTSVQEESYSAIYLASESFDHYFTTNGQSTNGIQGYVDIFLDQHADVAKLTINSEQFANTLANDGSIRDEELLIVQSTYTEITVDISDTWRFIYGMNIAYTCVIIILFSSVALWIASSVRRIVLVPIEDMTAILHKMTKYLCLVGNDFQEQDDILQTRDETKIIIMAMNKIVQIFEPVLTLQCDAQCIDHDADITRDPTLQFAHSKDFTTAIDPQLADSARKKTRVNHRNGGLVVITTEKQDKPFINDKFINYHVSLIRKQRNGSGSQSVSTRQSEKDITDNEFDSIVTKNPELKNAATIVKHPIASQYFRCFCNNRFLGNRFRFLTAIDRFHQIIKAEYLDIYQTFVADLSKYTVPINQDTRDILQTNLTKNKLGTSSFEQMTQQSLQALQAQGYFEFLNSGFGKAYIDGKDKIFKKLAVEKNSVLHKHAF